MNTHKPTRREFLKAMGVTVAASPVARMSAFAQAISVPSPKPNVLFIVIDDLNDWVGSLGGHPNAQTPNLDRLAQRGVLFTNAHCPAPICNPSRTAVMTGIRPSTSGIYGNLQPLRKSPALGNALTLPQHFMAHGYHAMTSGKIFHHRWPDPKSWHESWPSHQPPIPCDPEPPEEKRPLHGCPELRHFDWGSYGSDAEMGDWKVADWTIDQLRKAHKSPFFLACGFHRPHKPWYVPQKYFKMHPLEEIRLPIINEMDLSDVPYIGRKLARRNRDHELIVSECGLFKEAVQAYLASISFVDVCVGRVVNALERSQYAQNTIIVLWSDHGRHLGEKRHWDKSTLWEEATRIPLIFVAPGLTPRDGRCSAPVNLIDIYPTLVELCGLSPIKELEGISLRLLLENPKLTRPEPSLTTYGWNNHATRSKRWRYIRYYDGSEELYDHDNDSFEWTNLALDPRYAAIKQELKRFLPQQTASGIPHEQSRYSRCT